MVRAERGKTFENSDNIQENWYIFVATLLLDFIHNLNYYVCVL